MGGKGRVQAEVELVLMVVVAGGAGVVVGRGEAGGEGDSGEQGEGRGVKGSGDNVVRELGAGELAGGGLGGGGVVDSGYVGEDALALREGGDGGDAGDADALPDALIVCERKEVGLRQPGEDGTAEGGTVEIAAVLGFAGGGGGEVVTGVESFVAEILKEAAVEL